MDASDGIGYPRDVADQPTLDFSGLTALVTGSTSGIGAALADALEHRGATVIRHGLESGQRSTLTHDLSVPGAGRELGTAAMAGGGVDILVHAASVQRRTAWNEISSDEFNEVLQTNLIATLELIQAVVPGMVSRGWGRVLTLGSVQQLRPHPQMAAYAASKAAQASLVRNLAKQLAPHGVTVNNLAPGVIDTPRNVAALADTAYRAGVVASIPAGRIGTVEDCVWPALMLCAREGAYLTGQDIVVDGGMSL
jgi:NAD(P)-dependent dehydrogenase (short-subunit alcohol dehydrogenase family)